MKRIVFIICLMLLLPSLVEAGIVIEMTNYSKVNPDEKEKTIIYISKNRVKMVESDGNYTILDLNKETLYRVNPRKKSYLRGDFNELIREVKEAIRQIQQETDMPFTKLLPPEKTAPAKPALETEELTIKNTGQTTKIAGYSATRYQVYKGKRLDEEVWISQDLELEKEISKELKYKKFAKLYRELEQFMEAPFGPLSTSEEDLETTELDRLYEQGWVMKSIDHSIGEVTEVIKVDKKDIPDKEFQVPANFKKVSAKMFFMYMGNEDEEEN